MLIAVTMHVYYVFMLDMEMSLVHGAASTNIAALIDFSVYVYPNSKIA